jgi:ABC-type sulfate/molybdate transport systems ATPase subunit
VAANAYGIRLAGAFGGRIRNNTVVYNTYGLDAPTRASLRGDLADVLADETAVYVTHDRTTARAVADRVAVVADGRVRQVGDPAAVFERPNSPFVARFTGANCLPRRALPAAVRDSLPAGDHVAVRPEHVVVGGDTPDATAGVVRSVREDAAVRVTLSLGAERLDAFTGRPPDGERVGVSLPREHCHVVPGDGA